MKSVEMIFFDAANTLISVKGSVGKIYADVARSRGLSLDAGALNARFREIFRDAPPLCFPNLPADALPSAERAWWKILVAKAVDPSLFKEPDAFEGYFSKLYETFAEAESWEVFDDVIPALTDLRKAGFRLGVISNFDSRLPKILRALGLSEFFERIVCSSQSGHAKPDREIFLHALPKDLQPHQALHIGDDPILDLAGALRAGLRGLLVDRKGLKERKDEVLVLRSLAELKSRALSSRSTTSD